MARITWSRIARDELKEIIAHIHAESPAYARLFALRIRQRIA